MSHRPRKPIVLALAGAITLALVPGCASHGRESTADSAHAPVAPIHAIPERSGFLRDYSSLRPSPRHDNTLYHVAPDLPRFTAFIIDPIQVLPGAKIGAADAAELTECLRAEIERALSAPFSIVDRPGDGVARIRAAITKVARSGRDPQTGAVQIGGAAMEVEIIDSLNGGRLLAAVEADSPDALERAPGDDPYGDARLVFSHWAARLNRALHDARSGDLPPTR